MSMRPLIYPVKSICTLIDAIGCDDTALAEKMVDAFRVSYERHGEAPDDELVDERREWANSFVNGALVDDREPSELTLACQLAATALGLSDGKSINEDWKWFAWSDYNDLVYGKLPAPAAKLLLYLVEGRPFKGTSQEGNGVYHAWLDQKEIQMLTAALTELSERDPEIEDEVDGFHLELLGWLEACEEGGLLLVAM